MPARKRARISQATSPTHTSPAKSPSPPTAAAAEDEDQNASKSDQDLINDPWTDEEEIGLLKGLMVWKPTGIHKHFHLLALHGFLLEEGYVHPKAEHTRPAGIWRKLQSLYDLEALDEREDARQLSDLSLETDEEDEVAEADVYSEAENKIHREDFALPEEDFEVLMWRQRFTSKETGVGDGGESELELPEVNLAEEPPVIFTPSFSMEPSEAATPSGRGARGRPGKGRVRSAVAGTGVMAGTSTRRSARQAESVAGEDGEDEEDEDDEEVEESEEVEQSEASSVPARSTRTSRGRGRGGARGRARGRGRGR